MEKTNFSLRGRGFLCLIFTAFFLCFSSNTFSHSQYTTSSEKVDQQIKRITGTIVDSKGEPIIGANVKVKNTSTGTITDLDGKFSLEVPENAILSVTYIGYESQDVAVGNQNHINVILIDDAQVLDEVVVVGYGVQKKRDLTGAISSVKMDDTPVGTFSTISHALGGKAAGMQVLQTSAQVGGGSTFRIRGSTSINAGNDPLFIIDGFPVTASNQVETGTRYEAGKMDNILESINPNDIASIEILKDASATAIYGSRAANGVVIITTKRGKTGKAQVTYSGNFSVQNMKNGYKMLNGREYRAQRNHDNYEKWMKTNGQGIYADYITPPENVEPFKPRYTDEEVNNAQTTDWFDAVTRTGTMQSHNISLMGGSETTQYLASVNYFTQKGVVKNNNMDRLTAKINLDQELSKYFKTGISVNISRNKYDHVPLGKNEWENSGIISSAVRFDPSVPVRDENGNYSKFPDMGQYANPVSLLDIKDKEVRDRVMASSYVQAQPIKELILKATLGFDRRNIKRSNYVPTTTLYGASVGGQGNVRSSDYLDYLMDLTATYMKDFGNHNFTALVGYSYQQFNYETVNAGNTDFPTDSFFYNNLGAGGGAKPSVGSSAKKSSMGSYFARANYSYMGKYLLTATIRADGSSDFDPDYRWGYFPSVSLGWRFSDENFMKKFSHFLSNGKLRAGWGQTGNISNEIGSRIFSKYGVDSRYVFGEAGYLGIATTQLGNRTLSWETTSEFNIGLDLGFLDNRINLSLEYYNRRISDLLVKEKPLPFYNEVNKLATNSGKTQGQGFELTLNTVNISNKDFTWSTDATFYLYRDKWLERDINWKPAAYESTKDPIRPIYKYVSDGLLQAGEKAPAWQPKLVPGQVKLKKLDLEHNPTTMNQYDQVLVGSEDPDFTFGLNNTLRYKNFDLNVYFYGEFGRWRGGSYYDLWTAGYTGNPVNPSRQTLNAWAHDNMNTKVPSVVLSEYSVGDYYYKKINFIRCRNITLGYTLPVAKSVANSIRFSATVNNPFTITNWNGVDPETDSESYAYPNVTTFSLGVDITF